MSTASALAPDAAMVLGIASTAMPFARTPEDEAERWLRVLRLHGEGVVVLQALGVSEGRLREPAADADRALPSGDAEDREDAVARVAERAAHIAAEHGTDVVATTDVLLAVMDVYGPAFDRVLSAHGSDRAEVLERLG